LRQQPAWPIWSRGAKSLEAKLDDPAVKQLALDADVLIDTFRPGVLEKYGLGHEQLAATNPRLITVAITAFGRNSPYAKRKGYEGVVMAKIGAYAQFSALTSRGGPAFITTPYCAVSAAQVAITGALTAIYEREKSGMGQRAETNMVQAIAAHDTWNWMISHWAKMFPDAFQTAPVVNTQRRIPNSWISYGLLQGLTKDGRWLQFSQATPKLFRAFLVAAGLNNGDWEDAWQDEDLDRREAFWDSLLGAVRSKTVAEWQQTFDEHPDVFAEVFRGGTELLHHPQLMFDDQVVDDEVAGYGKIRRAKPFVRLSKTKGLATRPVPALNEHGPELRARKNVAANAVPAAASNARPLDGVTIVELGTFYAAPFGVTMLTDFGARVIKIEQLDGDPIRHQVPFPEIGGVKVTQGKESLGIDINTPEGLAIVKKLVAGADLILQSFRAGVAKRLGLDEASVRQLNPNVVYHEAPGFGTGGPYGHRPAYAPTIGAGSGLARRNIGAALVEGPEMTLDEVKEGAIRLGASSLTVGHADGFASLGVACGQMLGLVARERGAGAQGVVTTMLTTLGQVLSEDMFEYEGRPQIAKADPDLLGVGPLYRLYNTASGWIFLAAPQDDEWSALKAALPKSAGLDDARFASAEGRAKNAAELASRLEAAFKERTAADWEQILVEADIGCAEVDPGPSHDTIMAEGGLADRLGMSTRVEHPIFGEHSRLKALVNFSRSQTRAERAVLIGEQTAQILSELGMSEEEIAGLESKKVVVRG
ncbi:MAG: CoA transferase, partial [Caulobacterales bacterium]